MITRGLGGRGIFLWHHPPPPLDILDPQVLCDLRALLNLTPVTPFWLKDEASWRVKPHLTGERVSNHPATCAQFLSKMANITPNKHTFTAQNVMSSPHFQRKIRDICHIWIEKWQLYATFLPYIPSVTLTFMYVQYYTNSMEPHTARWNWYVPSYIIDIRNEATSQKPVAHIGCVWSYSP